MKEGRRISWSEASSAFTCPKKTEYRYDEGLRPIVSSPALEYGTAIHEALAFMLMEDVQRKSVLDEARDVFSTIFLEAEEKGMAAPSGWTLEELRQVGNMHLEMFHDWLKWAKVKTLAVEVYLTRLMPNGYYYSGQIDWIYETRSWGKRQVVICEHKTPAAPYTEAFIANDGQLTGYKYLVEGEEAADVIPEIKGCDEIKVAYSQLIKRKPPRLKKDGTPYANSKGPEFIPPVPVERSDRMVEEFLAFVNAAVYIRSQPGFRFAGMGFSSPCNMCEYQDPCIKNTLGENLEVRKRTAKAA